MKVITAPEEYERQDGDIFVFLAGGIQNCRQWQEKVIYWLQNRKSAEFLEHLVVFNPRRLDFSFDDPTAAEAQISWEFRYLEQADIFSVYFCNSDSVQPICMYELGSQLRRIKSENNGWVVDRLAISIEDGYSREQDVRIQTKMMVMADWLVQTKATPLTHATRIAECAEHLYHDWYCSVFRSQEGSDKRCADQMIKEDRVEGAWIE